MDPSYSILHPFKNRVFFMEKMAERGNGFSMFSEEELREMSCVKVVDEYVEVTCGCTSHRYGDAVGRLRVFLNGDLQIICECTPGCEEGISPSLSS